MDDNDRPNLSLGVQATITDERYHADRAAWQALRPLLKPKEWNETTRFNSPRPPKRASEFYLILSNYSTQVFLLEAAAYPRFPPHPHFRNWLINLAQRVEDHVIGVVNDIKASDHEKDFSYHGVAEDEMRKTIRQRLEEEMKYRFPLEFPRSSPLPQLSMKLKPAELRKIGIDPENTNPLLQEVVADASRDRGASPAPEKTERGFGEELDRLLREARKSPEYIAEKIGVDPTTVYRHKSGKYSPTRTTVGKYEKALSGILGYDVRLPTPTIRQKAKTPVKRQ